METRRLGRSELHLTEIGLGTWAMGGGGWAYAWGPQDDEASIQTIYRAMDLGINWIDTAPIYGLGHAETVVGKAIRGMRERPIIATKCGLIWDESGRIFSNLRKESVMAEADRSLKRLGVEVIDLYQIHWPNPVEQIEEGWDAISRLIQAGKVRYGGVSNFSIKQIERISHIHPVTSLQPPYSLLVRHIEDALPYCQEHEIGVISYSPLQKGLLSGKLTRERVLSLPPDDHRRRDPMFQEPELGINLTLVETLRAIANRHGKSVSHLAIAWILRRPEITGVIVGARRPEQIEETVGATGWRLPDPDLVRIEEALYTRREALRALKRNETTEKGE